MSPKCWKTIATFERGRTTTEPSTTMRPSSSATRPCMARSKVVFPHPDGPSTQTDSWSRTARSRSAKTVSSPPPNVLLARSTTRRSATATRPRSAPASPAPPAGRAVAGLLREGLCDGDERRIELHPVLAEAGPRRGETLLPGHGRLGTGDDPDPAMPEPDEVLDDLRHAHLVVHEDGEVVRP